ncbi:MAG: NADH-quinone oxidoreductase subunit NuoK [Thermanaerothrix sp.]|jgi:NADH:ubiquinone oxidoreductase subunit K|uniref:NADH-quinone oxidoreductase subunit K n=1 Tax=Thermanaerothrix solaris TaxID=3058434 RepID=A0ABU3NMG3_9CHLR|nr:NADH-quinone oxidoreductase subunit K [Thermanaerothrix sp. 4228-RoL]MDT8897021.1 NADH-quinone oxidoreductase subunit K [Thermanaerothrix sp. 4228-RoL]
MDYLNGIVVALTILGLVGIGIYAIIVSRNLIKVVVGLQIMVKGVLLAFVLAGRASGNIGLGQSLALTVIVVDTIVAVVALALTVQVRRRFGSLDPQDLTTLRR